ncbi:restriction endonuclease [Coprococcus comes]|uniref:restriction endonuclease n=1 Tax=Coprococcus comes TaxID=410072 RepID=UPI0034A3E3C2
MLISDFTIMCDDCGRKYRIPSDSLDVDYVCSERPMGTEVQHIFCGVMDCQCGNRLSYKITAVEYPEGAYNFHTCESVGCTYIDEPSAEMDYYLPEPVLSIYEEILQNPGYVYNLEPCEFEELVADVFRRMGFNADVTQKTHDGGKDIVATFEMGGGLYTTYFECKRYSPDRPVGVEIVRELYAVMEMERVDKGVIVTTSHFTRGAVAEAQRLNGRIRLIDFDELCRLMQQK